MEKNEKLEEQLKELQAQAARAPIPAVEITPPPEAVEVSVEEQNRLRQEGRQQLENEMNERLRVLNDKVIIFATNLTHNHTPVISLTY